MSTDIQVPDLAPWRTLGGVAYADANGTLPTGGPIASPNMGAAPVGNTSDFDPNWRSVVAALGSIDLNRKLTDYRQNLAVSFEQNATNGTLSGAGSQAEKDRQQLAKDIFDRLAAATG